MPGKMNYSKAFRYSRIAIHHIDHTSPLLRIGF